MPSTGNAIGSFPKQQHRARTAMEIVLRRRHGKQRVFAERSVVDQRCVLARLDEVANSRLEAHCPVVRLDGMPAPCIRVQVVHDVSAAYDQHAGVAQRTQPLADFMVKVRRSRFVDAQLYDRYIRVRKDVAQHGPGAVIESPAGSRATSSGASSRCTSRARVGSPGAGYWTANSSRGKPPKS